METNRLIHLLAKKMGKNASEEEIEELQKLLNNNPEFTFFSSLMDTVKSEKQTGQPVDEERWINGNWEKFADHFLSEHPAETAYPWQPDKKRHRWKSIMQRAAVWIGLIILLGGSVFFLVKDKETVQPVDDAGSYTTNQVAEGAPKQIDLPDGSGVWLNAGSRIRYAKDFTGEQKREIFLEGEAYFDVTHDAEHPFIVHAGNVDIRVLGTTFNVQAYHEEGKVETTLINGKIKVQVAGNPDKSFVLQPNEKLTVAMDAGEMVVSKAQTVKKINPGQIKTVQFKVEELKPPTAATQLSEIAWLKDKLVFQNESFEELAKSLERRYGVIIVFDDETLKNEKLNGVFKNENIQKALKILQMTTPFDYKMKGDTVYLRR